MGFRAMLGEEGYDFAVEGGDVVGLAAGDKIAVDHDLLVDPFGPSAAYIRFQGWPRSDAAATGLAFLDDGPGTVANYGDGFLCVEEGFYEGNDFGNRRGN